MPDPNFETVSATESPALFNASPYDTRWTLFQAFAKRERPARVADSRMEWGKKMEPLLVAEAVNALHYEVHPNAAYYRRGVLGATRDADAIDPSVGPGALETKCVFDYGVWMQAWGGGLAIPRHYEIQLQQQMFVGDGRDSFRWGSIAVWVCGEMHYYRRDPMPDLWATLSKEATAFLADVATGRAPDPFGLPVELPYLTAIERTGEVLDLTEHPKADELVLAAMELAEARDKHGSSTRTEAWAKPKLLAAAGEASEMILPQGIQVSLKSIKRGAYSVEASKFTQIKIYVPPSAVAPSPRDSIAEVLAESIKQESQNGQA